MIFMSILFGCPDVAHANERQALEESLVEGIANLIKHYNSHHRDGTEGRVDESILGPGPPACVAKVTTTKPTSPCFVSLLLEKIEL